MNAVRKFELAASTKSFSKLTVGVFAAAALCVSQAHAQSPYLLPYTIQVLAGGGTSVTVGAGASTPCLGTGSTGVQYDSFGDGCPITSSSVVVGSANDLHDVVVDQQGNVYFLDNSSNGVVRRIDARSGIITVYAGSYVSQTGVCAATLDKYGDACLANDGRANAGTLNGTTVVPGTNTGAIGKARGLGIDKNGDVFISDYTNNVTHKVSAATGIMSVVAGSLASGTKLTSNGGVKGFSGDGSIAFNPAATPTPQGAAVNTPRGITADAAGDVFIADSSNNVVRVVYQGGAAAAALITLTNPSKTPTLGYIYTVVGSDANAPTAATAGATGDLGLASAATLNIPEDVEVDANGNLFIGDFTNNKIRVVYAGGAAVAKLVSLTNSGAIAKPGFIYTVVGGGAATYTAGTQVLATSVPIGNPRKLTLDSRSNIFIADNTNNIIWFVDVATGYMRPIAGTYGSPTNAPAYCTAKSDAFGDNCPALNASFVANSAMGVSIDGNENLYIGDSGDARLRKVVTNQNFPATAAGLTVAQALQVHFGAGDSPAAVKPYSIGGSQDFVVAASNCTLNADTTQDCLVTVNFTPSLAGIDQATFTVTSTLNGAANFGLTGVGTAASLALDPGAAATIASLLKSPQGIALDLAGNTYIADTGNNAIVRIVGGLSFAVAGNGTSGYSGDGAAAASASLNGPKAVAVSRSGLIYIADTGNNVIRQINPITGIISTVAGGASAVCSIANDTFGDGCPGTSATLKSPSGLVADADGNIYIADTGNSLIRELTPTGNLFLVGGGATAACNGAGIGNGCAASGAIFANPTGLAIDASRNIFIADTGNNEIREIASATGLVTAVAGNGIAGGSGNGSSATGAQLSGPTGVAVDAAGDVYIADTGNSVIRVVNASGNINTAVGTLGSAGTGTVPGIASGVLMSSPAGVVSSGAGTLAILDSGNNRALSDIRTSVTYSFGRTNLGSSSPTLQIQQTDTGNASVILGASGGSIFTPVPTPPFAIVGSSSAGCSNPQTLTPGAACLLLASFTPSATQLGAFSQTYSENTQPIFTPTPSISLSGVGAILTTTTSKTVVTNPATGSPQYPVPFTVTTIVTPASCNTAAPACFPSGTVTFFVNGTQVGLPVAVSATGTASQTIPGQSVGVYAVTAVYSGDLFYASGSAPALSVTVTVGATTTVVSANPLSGLQFSPLSLAALVSPNSSVKTTSLPTGTVTFYAGATPLSWGTTGCGASFGNIAPSTGAAGLADVFVAAANNCQTHNPNSFGLPAGTYALTAVYSGDANYAPSTSAPVTLVIGSDPATFTVSLFPPTAGTAQGSTATVSATVNANNTLNGTIHFTCTNLPANTICTFGPPTTMTFAPVPGVPTAQQINITLFTDVPSGVTQTTSGLPGWPILILSCAGILAFRRRLRENPRTMRLLTVAGLFGILAGSSALMSGCSSSTFSTQVTPVGTYTINLVATGPNSTSVTTPITFIVGPGAPGQL